jgi:hypothetical protein
MFSELLDNMVAALFVRFEVGFQVIWEEEQPKHQKQYDQLDQDDCP